MLKKALPILAVISFSLLGFCFYYFLIKNSVDDVLGYSFISAIVLLTLLVILWYNNKIIENIEGRQKLNLIIAPLSGMLLLISEAITFLDKGFVFVVLLMITIFKFKINTSVNIKFFDRFMFAFSNCVYQSFFFALFYSFFWTLSITEERIVINIKNSYVNLIPETAGKFFISLFLGVIVSIICSVIIFPFIKHKSKNTFNVDEIGSDKD